MSRHGRAAPGHAAAVSCAARAGCHAAASFGPRRGLTGESLPPVLALTAKAQGVISAAHASVVAATVAELPERIAAEHSGAVEAVLVEQAGGMDPTPLGKLGRRIVDTLDPAARLPATATATAITSVGAASRCGRAGTGPASSPGDRHPSAPRSGWPSSIHRPHPPLRPVRPVRPVPSSRLSASWPQRPHDAVYDAGPRLLRCGELGITPALRSPCRWR
ncbi:MAG: DUF222 domain-containing protein [Mycobacteriales bacterium]